MTQDYEMLYLQAKEKQYLDLLEKQRYYEIFELPFLIKQIQNKIKEVCLEEEKTSDKDTKVSNLRTRKKDDNPSHSSSEIF